MTDDVEALLAQCDAAFAKMTPGPWRTFVRDIEQMSDGGKGYPLDFYPDCVTVHVGHPTVEDERTGNVGIRKQEDIDGIVTLVNAYPRLRDELQRVVAERDRLRSELQRVVADRDRLYAAADEALRALTVRYDANIGAEAVAHIRAALATGTAAPSPTDAPPPGSGTDRR